MSSYAPPRRGLLMKTPSYRQQAGRRVAITVCAFLALAMVSGLAGSLVRNPHPLNDAPHTGPFSYFPSE